LPAALEINRDRKQHRLADHDTGFAHPFVVGIQNEIRIGFRQQPGHRAGLLHAANRGGDLLAARRER